MNRTEILNYLIARQGYQRYLEIGLSDPRFNHDLIQAAHKTCVDPDPKGPCDYVMTSDEFFANHVGSAMYDLIFIDGSHLEEYTDRDIVNSFAHLQPEGMIVMHDCNPPTKWHSLRSYEEHLQNGGAWNGTTWRSFVKMRCLVPDIYAAVVDTDWGCGVIKRSTSPNRLRDHPDRCREWDYFDLNRKRLLNLIDEQAFLAIDWSAHLPAVK